MAGESPQELWEEISRWQRETGHSVETVYNMPADEPVEGLSDEQRAEATRLWERYQTAGGGFGSDAA